MVGRGYTAGMSDFCEQPNGTEQNLVLFLTGCSAKKPYYNSGLRAK